MQSIIKFFAIIMILSVIACSLRRKNTKTNTKAKTSALLPGYSRSGLEVATQKIAQKMCLEVGKEATYVFFGNIDNFINNTLPDKKIYEKIFKSTFREFKKDGYNMNGIQEKMMTTAMSAIGGHQAQQIPLKWKRYAQGVQENNKHYLEGLVTSTKGNHDKLKNGAGAAGVAGKIVKHGVKGPQKVVSNALAVDGITSMIVSKIIDVTIWAIQTKMMDDASSSVFSEEDKIKNMSEFDARIFKKNGMCGRRISESENDMGYLESILIFFSFFSILALLKYNLKEFKTVNAENFIYSIKN